MKLISIFKLPRLKKDIYYADFSINGQVKRRSLKVSTLEEAHKKWAEYLKAFEDKKEKLRYENNLFSTDIETGFNEFLDYKKKNVQNSTFAKESHIILKFKYFLIKNYFLKKDL